MNLELIPLMQQTLTNVTHVINANSIHACAPVVQ